MQEKIDMVYLWCDGNDPEFIKRKNIALHGETVSDDNEIIGDKRFFDNEELKYSLRSLEKYAPWINHVYIVTDRQIPKWLNTDYEKVTIVDHSEIMPKDIIPSFNSTVIEWYFAFIPNLSEKFLYGNDDMFFGDFVAPEDFFYEDLPIVRVEKIKTSKMVKGKSVYRDIVLNSIELFKTVCGKEMYYEPHHNIDAYRKSYYMETFRKYKSIFEKTIHNKFRTSDDFQRIIFSLELVFSHGAKLDIIKRMNIFDKYLFMYLDRGYSRFSYYGDDNNKTFNRIRKLKPKLFCLNSGDDTTVKAKLKAKMFMEEMFPKASKFEI